MQALKKDTIEKLRREILDLQGLGVHPDREGAQVSLGTLLDHMPGGVFPTGAVHEFLSPSLASAAAATGFITAIIQSLMQGGKPCVWISRRRMVFPPGMAMFGVDPDRFIFIDIEKEKEALWTIEEALKCASLGAVIGEINTLDFKQSRRLQLAVEHSRVTGFINRFVPRHLQPTACVARWQIQPANSYLPGGLPGMGFPRWKVELLKIRNGRTGTWQIEWSDNRFRVLDNTLRKIASPFLQTASA